MVEEINYLYLTASFFLAFILTSFGATTKSALTNKEIYPTARRGIDWIVNQTVKPVFWGVLVFTWDTFNEGNQLKSLTTKAEKWSEKIGYENSLVVVFATGSLSGTYTGVRFGSWIRENIVKNIREKYNQLQDTRKNLKVHKGDLENQQKLNTGSSRPNNRRVKKLNGEILKRQNKKRQLKKEMEILLQ